MGIVAIIMVILVLIMLVLNPGMCLRILVFPFTIGLRVGLAIIVLTILLGIILAMQ